MWGFTYVTEVSQIFRLLQQLVLKGKYWFCRCFLAVCPVGTDPSEIDRSWIPMNLYLIPWYNFNAIWKIWIEIFKSSSSFAGFRHSQLPLVTWRWTSHQQCNKKHWNASIPKNLQTQTSLSCMDLSDSIIMLKKNSSQKRMGVFFFKTKTKGEVTLTSHPKPPIPPPPGWWNHRDTMLQEVVKILSWNDGKLCWFCCGFLFEIWQEILSKSLCWPKDSHDHHINSYQFRRHLQRFYIFVPTSAGTKFEYLEVPPSCNKPYEVTTTDPPFTFAPCQSSWRFPPVEVTGSCSCTCPSTHSRRRKAASSSAWAIDAAQADRIMLTRDKLVGVFSNTLSSECFSIHKSIHVFWPRTWPLSKMTQNVR